MTMLLLLIGACAAPSESAGKTADGSLPRDTGAMDSPADSTGSTGDSGRDSGDSTPEETADTDTAPPVPISVDNDTVAAGKWIGQAGATTGVLVYDMDLHAIGDFDGDGADDVVVGLTGVGWTDGLYGCTYVVSGATRGSAVVDDIAAARIFGPANESIFGWHEDSAGDVDGDGLDELMVADVYYDADESTRAASGAVYVFDGPLSGDVSVDEATAILIGEEPPDTDSAITSQTGNKLAPAGDTNGDGFDDVLVGSSYTGTDYRTGLAYLVDGPLTGEIDLATEAAMRVKPADDLLSITWLDPGGDVDGDGLDDVVVSESADSLDVGKAPISVFLGPGIPAATMADGDIAFTWSNPDDVAGRGIGVGDLNGDGHQDLCLADFSNTVGGDHAGALAIHLGPFTSSVSTADAATTYLGTEGSSVNLCRGNADVNGDGNTDLAVPASDYLVYGPGNVYIELGPLSTGTFSVIDSPITISGSDQDMFGNELDWADVDGDGFSDLYLGGPRDDDGGDAAGATWLILGSSLQ